MCNRLNYNKISPQIIKYQKLMIVYKSTEYTSINAFSPLLESNRDIEKSIINHVNIKASHYLLL